MAEHLQPRLTIGAECCLTGISGELRNDLRRRLTIVNPKYQAAKKYGRWIGRDLKPKLTFYREESDAVCFPRGFGNRAVLLCDEVMGRRPQITDNRRRLDEIGLTFHGRLRSYQAEAVEAVLSRTFGVLEAGTGSGKTVMALKIIALRRQPTLIIVHSKELLYQWCERINDFLRVEAGIVGDGRFELRPVTVAIVNTARRRMGDLPSRFGQIIVDECHRVPATLFTHVVSGFDSYYMLGLSATAYRREDATTRIIYFYMGDLLHSVDSRTLERSGAVVKPEFIQRTTPFNYGFTGDYAKLIKALAADHGRNELIVGDIAAVLADDHRGTILVVSDRVAHCEELARGLGRLGIDAVVLTGRTPPDKRGEIVSAVRDGEVDVLISTLQLIGEGFDCPGLSTLVLATPIKFEGRLLQVVGRIMRPAMNKRARVIDYVDEKIPVLRRSAAARRNIFAAW